jgi:hypothetical protein
MTIIRPLVICTLLLSLSPAATAAPADPEIQYLLETIGQSQCVFIRNGKPHDASEAESHLRLKYSKGRYRIDGSEQFIERIASKSSLSGKHYLIDCPDAATRKVRDWLREQLIRYRRKKLAR